MLFSLGPLDATTLLKADRSELMMPPVAVDYPSPATNGIIHYDTDTMNPHNSLHFDKSLTPKKYSIKGTDPNSKILLTDVSIIDSTGQAPFRGDVYIEGERIKYVGYVPGKNALLRNSEVQLIEGRGRTLMSGLGDAHTHCSWNNDDLSLLGNVGVEEHTLSTARAARTYLDSGYTMCFGAASAKERLDCVIRDAINNGDIPGPRYLANGKEMAVPDGELAAGITAFASGPLEMREVIRHHVKLGVDQIKLSMSGEQITETRDAQDCYFSEEETAACVDEAHRHGIRVCAHARARDSVKQCVKYGVDVIYHASWTDDEGMDMLEKNKSKHVVAPAINWLFATVYEAAAFGYSFEKAEKVGYKKELEVAIMALKEMHRRGITVLPGGDYGFAWTPHGTYARDLEHFVKLLDFTPMESIVAATAGVAKLFMREHELGKILPGYFADCILVDGDPVEDISILQQHDKLNVILINGRVHKASYKDFVRGEDRKILVDSSTPVFRNFVAYELDDGTQRTRIGHLDWDSGTITPLSFSSGTPVETLYQVLEVGEHQIIASDEAFPLNQSVNILPPIYGRDILAVGKNYIEHAKEFNASGYDSSDKTDVPSFPVVFTKRATSIVANEEDILLHEDFTQRLDYEGEIAVILGKGGFRIPETEAVDHVWGYTIINDITARDRQRDHKQFYIGKSADTFCPMGPIAVPKHALPEVLTVTTRVNGEKRQEGTTKDLIFSIPNLIATLSKSQTLRAGDVIATGTPAGVGFGFQPPKFLRAGDTVEISVTGIGTLRNTVVQGSSPHISAEKVRHESCLPINNLSITMGGLGLVKLPNGKQLDVKVSGSGPRLVVFIHGLGGSKSFYTPLLSKLGLDTSSHSQYTSVTFDIEGHGLSPTSAGSTISISSLVDDLRALITLAALALPTQTEVTLVAHSMGCLVAQVFAIRHPELAHRLVLLGPAAAPLPLAGVEASTKRAATVRAEGMRNVAVAVATAATSPKTQSARPVAFNAVCMSLLAQDPEAYAKGCTALAGAGDLHIDVASIRSDVLIVAGEDDKITPKTGAEALNRSLAKSRLVVLPEVGHWHVFEDLDGVADALKPFFGL